MAAKFQEAKADMDVKFNEVVKTLNQQRQQGQAQLSTDKKIEAMSATLADMSLANTKYVDTITQIGNERRFYEAEAFNAEMLKLVMGENLLRAANNINFQIHFDVSERDFQRQLAEIDVDSAMQLAAANASQAQTQQLWQSGGKLAGAGVEAYQTDTAETRSREREKQLNEEKGIIMPDSYYEK
jgi:hypothetical protein